MKYILLLAFMLSAAIPSSGQQTKFKLSTFTVVPDDMYGCGNGLYLTQKDKKAGRMIYADDLKDAVLTINGKVLRFKSKELSGHNMLVNGRYRLDVKISNEKQEDDEYHTFDAVLTVYEGAKIVFKQKMIGDGGC